MKNIPKSFNLGPHEITVSMVSREEMAELCPEGALGLWVCEELTIYIVKPHRGLKKEVQLHTFWHEFFHALYWALGRMDESADEVLVDQCGLLTMQMHQTAKFK